MIGLQYLEAVITLRNINNCPFTFVSAYQPLSHNIRIANYDMVMGLNDSITIAGLFSSWDDEWNLYKFTMSDQSRNMYISNMNDSF